ncbi:MAG: DUF2341 domain-containing protein [Bacteriovoracaceae bacterium]|nr:DUF2341 domain-containing protein [Bacteriovoracaceae bacterium]
MAQFFNPIFKIISVLMLISSCTFDNAEEETNGGGLFTGHRPAENTITLSLPSNQTYKENDRLKFIVSHPYSLQVKGTPRLELDINGSIGYADYISGSASKSLVFEYLVQNGDNDSDGIEVMPNIDLNGGTITFIDSNIAKSTSLILASTPIKSNIIIDTTIASIVSVTPPLPKTYYANDQIQFIVTYSEPTQVQGRPYLELQIGTENVHASYIAGSGTLNHIYRYSIANSNLDLDGISVQSPLILNGGLIFDQAGNLAQTSFTPPTTSAIFVNGEAPYVTSITFPADKTYYFSEKLRYKLTFNENVNINNGNLSLDLVIGNDTKKANYASGSGSQTLIFEYEIEENDLDLNGVKLENLINLNSDTLEDTQNHSAKLKISPPLTPNILVNGSRPQIIALTVPTDGNYTIGQDLSFYVQFSEDVEVTNQPQLQINLDSGIVYAKYVSGSGTDTLKFNYTISSSDFDNNGISFNLNQINLNSTGTITSSLVTTINAKRDFTSVIPADMSNIKVNQSLPTKLVFINHPTSSLVGQNISPNITVEIRDAFDNIITAANNTITLAFENNVSGANLNGTISLTATNGVASFNDINIDQEGSNYTLKATSPGLTPAISNTFDINAIPTQLVITNHPSDTYLNSTINPAITVEVRDAANNLVTSANNSVTLTLANDPSGGTATLSGTLTVNAINGIATFNDITLDSIQTGYTLSFSSGTLTNATSNAFSILSITPTQLAFTQGPTDTMIGNNITPSIKVEIQDSSGNLVTSANDTVTLSLGNDPTGIATLSGTTTIAAINGIATFNDISINKAGAGFTLQASSPGLTNASSSQFDITAAPPTQLSIKTQPLGNITKDTIFSPPLEIEIHDANGNLVSNATNTIVIDFQNDPSSGAATLSGTTSIAAINGVATFNDIEIDTLGDNYSFTFTSSGLASISSNNFNVTSPASLSFNPISAYDYATVTLGNTKEATFLISHSGGPATNIAETTLTAPFSFKGGNFPGTGGTCSTTITADCTLVVVYTPTAEVTSNEILTIAYNDGTSLKSITKSLSGTGLSSTPTAINVIGPNSVVTNNCVTYQVNAIDNNGNIVNINSNETISLVINNGAGDFYSDSSCNTTTTSVTIQAGTNSEAVYFQSNTTNQSLTLIFNAATLNNTSRSINTSNEPIDIIANLPSEVIVNECTQAEISLVDSNGIKTGASTAQLIDIATSGDEVIYNDAFCTGQISQISFNQYEETKKIYILNTTIQNSTLNFSDNANNLTADNGSIDFVSHLTWYDANYGKRIKLSLNNLDQASSFTDIPILIQLDSSRIDYADFMANAEDIRFTLDNHSTVLFHSIDTWNTSGTSYIWVKIPNITANSEINIYMYYNYNSASNSEDSSSVWSNYDGVWLMNKAGTDYIDETGSGKTASANGSLQSVDGPIGKATYFNGSSSLTVNYDLAQTLGGTSTLSFWIKTSQSGDATDWKAPGITGLSGTAANQDLFYGYIKDTGRIGSSAGGGNQVESNFVVNDNTWRYVTVSRNETTGEFRYYINGVLNGSGNSGTGIKSKPFYDFGATTKLWGGGGFIYFTGALDSIRMSSAILTDARIKAEYKYSADTHITYSAPQSP